MYCTQCGAIGGTGDKFCGKCGAMLHGGGIAPATEKPKTAEIVARKGWLESGVLFLLATICAVGAYAALLIPALAGQSPSPSTGPGSIFWNWLFFYLWWRRRGKKPWHGGLIGVAIGIAAFVLAAFISGYVRASKG